MIITAEFQSKVEAEKTIRLALGRILSIGSRPFQEGDLEQYEKYKWLILNANEYLLGNEENSNKKPI